jgi:putative ABC transport system substrate-binding protein
MRRRNLILGLLAVAATGRAHAQQSRKAKRIAWVHPTAPLAQFSGKQLREFAETNDEPFLLAFFKEFDRLGYIVGQNLLIEGYSGQGRASHYPDLARDVVSSNPDLIITITTDLTLDFKAATTAIPIVGNFAAPVESGIVASLAQPGGNITGVAVNIGDEQWGKRTQLLRQLVPHLTKMAVLDTRRFRDGWEAQAPEYGRRWGVTYVGPPLNFPINEAEYRRVFAALVEDAAEGIVVTDETENQVNHKLIVELAEKNRLPAIYPFKMFVEAGGLTSYGVNMTEQGHNAAVIVGKILKGAKPADIPVFQPTKFDLAINLKAAKALGLTVPPELLAIADDVIE